MDICLFQYFDRFEIENRHIVYLKHNYLNKYKEVLISFLQRRPILEKTKIHFLTLYFISIKS